MEMNATRESSKATSFESSCFALLTCDATQRDVVMPAVRRGEEKVGI